MGLNLIKVAIVCQAALAAVQVTISETILKENMTLGN
jgi:hypothetical protein